MKFTLKFSFTLFAHSLNRLHKIFLSFSSFSLFFSLFSTETKNWNRKGKKKLFCHTLGFELKFFIVKKKISYQKMKRYWVKNGSTKHRFLNWIFFSSRVEKYHVNYIVKMETVVVVWLRQESFPFHTKLRHLRNSPWNMFTWNCAHVVVRMNNTCKLP